MEVARFEAGAGIEWAPLRFGPGFGRLEDALVDVRVGAEVVEIARPPERVARVGWVAASGVIGMGER
jgi:hypothetical protein